MLILNDSHFFVTLDQERIAQLIKSNSTYCIQDEIEVAIEKGGLCLI